MANSPAVCSSFKTELLNGIHAFGTTVTRGATTKDSFKMALYLATASLGAATTAYSATGELAATGNYSATGNAVTNATEPALDGTTAHWTPSQNVTWSSFTSSGAFDAALLYNDTQGDKAIAVFTFSSQSVTSGTFTLTMPTNNGTTGLIRVA